MTADERPVEVGPRSVRTADLTRTQSEVWTSQRLEPGHPVANMAYTLGIAGPVEADRLVRAFDTVVRACDVLRMVVVDDGARATARVLAAPPRSTEVIDLGRDRLDGWVAERIAVPIDARVCVYDSVLIRHADDDWTWWLDLHHVATDARSSSLVFAATSAAYEADDGSVDTVLEVVGGDYFAQAPSEVIADQAPAEPNPPLVPYGARGSRTSTVDCVAVPIDSAMLADALDGPYRSISRELALLALSVTALVQTMHRLDGRRSVAVGVPVHHRSDPVSRTLVGPRMELHPLTVAIEPDDTNRSLHQRVLRSIMQLIRTAKPGVAAPVRFEIVANVFASEYGDFAGMPTLAEWRRTDHVDPDHPVRSQVTTHDDVTIWELDVNTSLSVDGSARRFHHHLANTVTAMIAAPDAAIGDAPLVSEAEVAELAALTPLIDPVEHDLVHEQIRRALQAEPDWVVAEERGNEITALDFDRRADALGAWLIARGLTTGRAVGLRMARGIDVLVAIHGVLRAGGVFVMLDPADPEVRHEAIIADAQLLMVLDELPDLIDVGEVDRPDVELDAIAYILYTSGSTGAPKGVPIPHRGLADYLRFAVDTYVGDGPPPTVALHSALVFDLTITSLFLAFLTGGRTVVFPDEPVVALGEIAADGRIDVLKATPSQLEVFTRVAEPGRPLRSVIVGGEAFRRPVAERLAAICHEGVRIFNEYGPTEAVVGCMIHEWDPTIDTDVDVPIGYAAPGSAVRIVDAYGHPAAIGSWGELLVSRPGMASGYLNRPELTAERFERIDGDIWYRTGDRARVVRHGVAVYGGRIDDQVKVNGIRLEPAEVEAALMSHPSIENVLVRVWSPRPGTAIGDEARCARCGLGPDVPGVTFSIDGVCSVCHSFDAIEPQTRDWFKTEADLDRRLAEVRRRSHGDIDALHLLSGGKDSTYALYQLVERGWRVHALTLDNGFISDGAKENIRRSVADLGITHEFATTDAMNEIFRDSLERYSNVCQGCYKTIYTLAVARAREMGIPVIVTGLSRGQFFETRLVPHQFEHDRFDPDEIDRTVLEARKVYHHTTDAVTELLPEQAVFDDDRIFDEIEFVDFYRYVDVDLAELYTFLEERAPWVRPADTGRSTNCLINVAGIQVHRSERGFHNYAEPYSWDVRLGHKTRAEALDELDDEVDPIEVERLLAEIGYVPNPPEVLTAWYQSADGADLDPDELRAHVRATLPEHAVPSAFVRIDEVPMAASAKADPSLLPAPTRFHRRGAERVEPSTPTEVTLCSIWAEVLGLEAVGVTDDFFDLGGASLAALEVVAAIDDRFGTDLHDAAVFRSRTVRQLAAVVDRVVGEPTREADDSAIPAVVGNPLTAAEEAMLFEQRLDPDSTRYNITRLYTVEGDVDIERFEAAVRDVVALHDTLHTSYAPGRPALAVDDAVLFDRVDVLDDAEFVRFAEAQGRVPFDLDAGPLVRVHVAQPAAHRTLLLVGMHHVSIDAGTFDVLWSQIATRYAGGGLPELSTTYAAHGAWQRARRVDEHRAFWSARSAVRAEAAPLGLAPPVPAAPDGFVSRPVDLQPADLTIAGGTAVSAAIAATAVVFSRVLATEHVQFGIAASVKDHVDTAPMVGCFLNTLPLDLDAPSDWSFEALVRRSADVIADALPHRSYPLASMQQDARAAGHEAPGVSLMLTFQDTVQPELDGLRVEQRVFASGTAIADISLVVQNRAGAIELGVDYRGAVISSGDAERLLDLFESVLTEGVARPSTMVADLVERHLGGDLVGAELDTPEATVIATIARRAAEQPDEPAVIDATGGALSYADMAAAVDALAERVVVAAGGSPHRVGVAVRRSSDLVVAMLAVQSSGAAAVPVDPSVGPERLARIVTAAELDVLVVDAGGPTFDVPADRLVVVDPHDRTGSIEGFRARAERVALDASASVIFTSGSTGRPRGVEVRHRHLAASTYARPVWYGVDPERFLLTSSVGFDSSAVGLYWPLTTGGTIVMPSDDDVHDVDRLGALVETHAVTHLLMVPSLYAALLARAGDRLVGLRTAIVAGEACPASLVATHERQLPTTELVNEYGPTEATVWATAHRLSGADTSIGGPIPGTTVRVADDAGHRVPLGVAGELLIAGPGVTDGYLDDADATATRFVDVDGRRWYRSGDRVRDVGGVLEFVGRVDEQLNVGGVRLEPGEVEAALRTIDGVRDAVVVAVHEPPVLVAHLEADEFDEAVARTLLASRLPPGSVPRRFVVHPSLPRTDHGKIDRRAAASLPVGGPATTSSNRSTLVDSIITTWRTALGRDDVWLDSVFFDLGGDSLSAVQIVTDLGERLGRDVSIGTLLGAPTPATLARALGHDDVDRPSTDDDDITIVTLREGAPDGPLIVMTPAWDDVFGYQALAASFPEHVRIVGVAYTERPGRPVLTTVAELVDRCVAAVATTVGRRSPVSVLGWSVGGVVATELADRLRDAGVDVDVVALVDTFFPGQHRHLWSNRWWKYKSMLRPGSMGTVVGEFRTMGVRRVKRLVGKLGRSMMVWSGAPVPDEPERTSVGGFPVAALDHPIDRVRTPMLFFAASLTNPDRTLAHWHGRVDELEVVPIDGRHRGLDSVMAADRVHQISGPLVERLSP